MAETTSESPQVVPTPGARRAGAYWLSVLGRVWVWIFLTILVTFFSLKAPAFFSVGSAMNVMTTAAPVLLLAIGQTFVIISGGIDMSVGWIMGLGSVEAALMMRDLYNQGTPEVLAIALGCVMGIAVSLVAGAINGFLVARAKVPPFIATLGMFSIARGIALLRSEGNVVAALPPNLKEFGSGNLMYILRGNITFFQPPENLVRDDLREILRILPYPVIVTILVTILFAFILGRTRFGRRTYTMGGSMQAAIRAGIPVRLHQFQLYLLSAGLAGLSGFLYTARFTGGSYQAGESLLLDSVAAVVIGGASMFGGTGNVAGTVVGALIISVLTTGLVIMNVPPFWQYVAVGCVIVLAVLIDQARSLLERLEA